MLWFKHWLAYRRILAAAASSAGSAVPPAPDAPDVIVADDNETDNDGLLLFMHAISKHKAGMINLIGVEICSRFDTSPCAARVILDAYGMSSVPVGWSARTGSANPNFFNDQIRDRFGVPGQTGSSFSSSLTVLRTLIAANSGVYIVTGGFMKGIAEFMNSPADGISNKSGMQLITDQGVKLFAGLGRRPGDGTGEQNSGFHLTSANDITVNWPNDIKFFNFPQVAEVPQLHVHTGGDPYLDPARYIWDLCANSRTLSGDFGSVTLNDSNDERGAGDTAILQMLLDDIAGTPTANFSLSAIGQLVINASTGVSTWTFPGHGRHTHGTATTSKAAFDTAWQAIIDGLAPPTRVNLWRSSAVLSGTADTGGTKTDNNATAPDGTMTADTISGAGYANYYTIWTTPAGKTWTFGEAIKKTSGHTRFAALNAQCITNAAGTVSSAPDVSGEANCTINTNTGAGYAATGGVAPAEGSTACTVSVVEASTIPGLTGLPNPSDYWYARMTWTTPAATQSFRFYLMPSAGNNASAYGRDGLGGSTSKVMTCFQMEPAASMSSYLPTDGDATFVPAA